MFQLEEATEKKRNQQKRLRNLISRVLTIAQGRKYCKEGVSNNAELGR